MGLEMKTSTYIDEHRDEIIELSQAIWENPEIAFEEHFACEKTAEYLRNNGFAVETGVGGLKTAIRAVWGSGHPVIGFLGEYDALPGLAQQAVATQSPIEGQKYGHACGHNLIAAATASAVVALKEEADSRDLPGTFIFFGCPAEEGPSGKAYMANAGLFDDLDAAVSFHPFFTTLVAIGSSTAITSAKFHFKGKAAHAAGAPHNGRSALDAVELMNVGTNYLREHIPSDARLHYVITDGGGLPNIVPAKASVWYYVRAPHRDLVDEVYKRLIKVADGAATMTETAYEIEYLGGCYELLSNKALADLLDSALQEIAPEPWSDEDRAFAEKLDGYTPETAAQWRKMFNLPSELHLFDGNISITPLGSPGSTDVGDVSHIVPTIFFMTTCSSIGASSHTWQFTACTGSSIGQKGMIHAAKIMARFGIRLLEDPEVLDKAKEEFLKETVGSTYQCPIPKELLDTHG